MTSKALEYDVIIYTPYVNHYENVSVNHLKFKKAITGATQVNSATRAHHTINQLHADWIKSFVACVIEISICFHSGWHMLWDVSYVMINEKLSW